MTRTFAAGWLLATALAGPLLLAQTDDLSANDKDFIELAGESDLLLVRLSQMAEMQAFSPELKNFALALEREHSADLKKVVAIADKYGGIPPNTLDNVHKEVVKRLAKSKGKSFDHAFLKAVVNQYENMVVSYQREADHGFNPALQAYAKRALPNLDAHAKQAKKLASE